MPKGKGLTRSLLHKWRDLPFLQKDNGMIHLYPKAQEFSQNFYKFFAFHS